jgi:hypothetical protein
MPLEFGVKKAAQIYHSPARRSSKNAFKFRSFRAFARAFSGGARTAR